MISDVAIFNLFTYFFVGLFGGLALFALFTGIVMLPLHILWFLLSCYWEWRRDFSKDLPVHY